MVIPFVHPESLWLAIYENLLGFGFYLGIREQH